MSRFKKLHDKIDSIPKVEILDDDYVANLIIKEAARSRLKRSLVITDSFDLAVMNNHILRIFFIPVDKELWHIFRLGTA